MGKTVVLDFETMSIKLSTVGHLQSSQLQPHQIVSYHSDRKFMLINHIVTLLRKISKSIFVLFEKNAKNINDAASDIENTFSFPSFNLFAIFQQLKLSCSSKLLIAVLLTFGNHNAIILQQYRDILQFTMCGKLRKYTSCI